MLTLPEERRKWGESKGAGRGRGERREKSIFFFSPPPPPFPSFALAPTVRVTITTLPNLPLSYNQRWRLQQHYEHERGFAHPKYACNAGYIADGVKKKDYCKLPYPAVLWLSSYGRRLRLLRLPLVLVFNRGHRQLQKHYNTEGLTNLCHPQLEPWYLFG